jgi:hypothetical protein
MAAANAEPGAWRDPLHDVVRSGLAVPVPIAVGIAVHQVPAGLFANARRAQFHPPP